MPSFNSVALFFFVTNALLIGGAQAQLPPAVPISPTPSSSPPPPSGGHDAEVIKLDRLVVSAGPQDKTAFDLAQGTSIVAAEELRRHAQATLGETLAATPGVNSTYYGPGASRPVIRGLGGDRVRVLESGIGALDASNVSPDHNTAIEPLFAERIEVLRGPATLLYGSSAVGGVVNVIDNRIPAAPLPRAFSGAIEMRGLGAARERAVVAALSEGTKNFRVQVDGLRLRTEDLEIPGVARIDEDAPANQPPGTLPNSDSSSTSGSVGASWFWDAGHLGASVSTYQTTYGVPVNEPISIKMKQQRLDFAGETTKSFGVFRGAKARLGFGNYEHREIADRTTINTTFKNKAWEGRVELPFLFPGGASGTLGAQASRSNFAAVGEEVATPPSVTENAAVFALEEWKLGRVTLQAGARGERQLVKLGVFDSSRLPAVPGYSARSGQTKNEHGASGSVGLVYYPAKDWATGLSLAYTERLPSAQELFSNGPHGGTGAYEVGTAGLADERSTGLEASLRRRVGFVTGAASVFVNTFRNYIFEEQLAPAAIPLSNNPDRLTPYQFTAKNAQFCGAEAELAFHLIERESEHLHLNLMSDYVHAQQTTDNVPLPRIPPLRYSASLRYERGAWIFGAEARHTARQTRFASTETETPGFTLLNADASYTVSADHIAYELFVRGTNLTNVEARLHTSFLKDFAPLAGRGIVAGLRMTF